jgi:lipoate-protein ligase A
LSYPFRLLDTGFHNAYYNMALDEVLLESTASGAPPVLRFFGWDPPAVSVGYFQGLREEVDTEACRRRGFDLVRRISGGGAVLHKSELTYSIAMRLDHPLAKSDLGESYRLLCGGLLEGLRRLGVDVVFSGINDILAGGKKVSGNAQTRRAGCLLQHGTVILDSDVDVMFEVLRVPEEKIKGKLIAEVKERVTGMKALLGKELSFNDAAAAFTEGFKTALDLEFGVFGEESFSVSAAEDKKARALAAGKFSTESWIYKR